MNRQLVMILACLGVSAYATSVRAAPEPSANTEVSESSGSATEAAAEAAGSDAVETSSEAEVIVAAEAGAEAEVTGADEAKGGVEVLDTPEVPKVAVIPGQEDAADKNEVVCRRERTTGSHRARRVCRSRAEIDRMAIDAKDTFDDLHKSQAEY